MLPKVNLEPASLKGSVVGHSDVDVVLRGIPLAMNRRTNSFSNVRRSSIDQAHSLSSRKPSTAVSFASHPNIKKSPSVTNRSIMKPAFLDLRPSFAGPTTPLIADLQHPSSTNLRQPSTTDVSSKRASFFGTPGDDEDENEDEDKGEADLDTNFNQVRRSSDPNSIPDLRYELVDKVSQTITHHGSIGSFGNDSIGGFDNVAEGLGGGGGGLGIGLQACDMVSMRSAMKKSLGQKSVCRSVGFQGAVRIQSITLLSGKPRHY